MKSEFKNWSIVFFSLIIACGYGFLYVLSNNDNANNLTNYQVGVVGNNNKYTKKIIDNLVESKKFKVKQFTSVKNVKQALEREDDINLGIEFEPNFSHALNVHVSKNNSHSVVKIFENSKKNQMNTLANVGIKNKLQEEITFLSATVSKNNITSFVNSKVQHFYKLKQKLKKLQQQTHLLKQNVTSDISYYKTLINNYEQIFNNLKAELNVDSLKVKLNQFKKVENQAYNLINHKTPEQIIATLLTKTTAKNLINSVSDIQLKLILQDYINNLKPLLNHLQTLINSNRVKITNTIKIKQVIWQIKQLNFNLKKFIAKIGLNPADANLMQKFYDFTSNLNILLANINELKLDVLSTKIHQLSQLTPEKFVKKFFNVDYQQIKLLASNLTSPAKKMQLQNKINQLSSGINQLSTGVDLFANRLSEVEKKFDLNKLVQNVGNLYLVLRNPLDFNQIDVNQKQTTGQALIGFALMLGLWVLCLFTIELFFDFNKFFITKKIWKPLLLITVFGLLHYTFVRSMNMASTNILGYLFSFILIGVCFYAIMFLFFNIFGFKAPLFLTLLLILMIVGSGATIPIELMPKFNNVIYIFDPLHYATNLEREIISSPNLNIVYDNIIKLLLIILLCISLSSLINYIKGKNRV